MRTYERDLQRLLTVIEHEATRVLVELLWTTGLRISEAAGLQAADIVNGEISVRRRMYQGELDEPKTAKSVRTIPVPEQLDEKLRTLAQGRDLVFAGLRPQN